MRDDATWRTRWLSFGRHAAAAAGLGVGWLLLSAGSAAASAPAAGDLLGTVAAPAPSSSVSALPGTVGSASGTTTALASNPTGTAAHLVQTATSAASTAVQTLPAVTAPLTEGLLAPLAPVVESVSAGSTAALGNVLGTVAGVTGEVTAVASDASVPLIQVPAPVLLADATSGHVAVEADSQAAPPPAAVLEAAVPEAPAPQAVAVNAEVGLGNAVASADQNAGASYRGDLLGDLLRPAPFSIAVLISHAPAAAHPDAPGWPAAPPLPYLPAPGSLGSSYVGPWSGAGSLSALTAVAFGLLLLWRFGPRLHPWATPLPASPCFDPGSTPD
ncbi:hypothetical protein GCM10027449_22150 [Sinomonas notoginsengisoli]|uniref:hypothetical protein n=1 Tax=Sinomonas notoginsengisoli TaxID=1457311 RepID=UPI001F366B91|nr:hypothetical protein [Sinomonas notoginsengisoli]